MGYLSHVAEAAQQVGLVTNTNPLTASPTTYSIQPPKKLRDVKIMHQIRQL